MTWAHYDATRDNAPNKAFVDFKQTIISLTSNLGAQALSDPKTLQNIDDLKMTSFKQNLISPTKRARNLSQNEYKNIIEVLTSLSLVPTTNNVEKIETKIIYSSIVELTNENIKKDEIEKIILINVPSEIYSELRQIFVFMFENSGFKDVKINEKIDFEKLYKLRKIQ